MNIASALAVSTKFVALNKATALREAAKKNMPVVFGSSEIDTLASYGRNYSIAYPDGSVGYVQQGISRSSWSDKVGSTGTDLENESIGAYHALWEKSKKARKMSIAEEFLLSADIDRSWWSLPPQPELTTESLEAQKIWFQISTAWGIQDISGGVAGDLSAKFATFKDGSKIAYNCEAIWISM